jgi:hypothetical protein
VIVLLLPLLCSGAPATRAADAVIGPTHGVMPITSMELRRLGFTADVEVGMLQSPGYVPIRLVVNGIGSAAADKRLLFRLVTHPNGERPASNGLWIDLPVTIAQGSSSTTVTRYVPKWSLGQFVDLSIYEDGQLLTDSLTQIGDPKLAPQIQFQRNVWGAYSPLNLVNAGFARELRHDMLNIAAADEVSLDEVPDLRDVMNRSGAVVLPDEQIPIGMDADPIRRIHGIGLAELPTDWRGYQVYDMVFMSAAAQRRLTDNPSALRAIRHWVLAGGTVVVYGAESLQRVTELWNFSLMTDPWIQQFMASVAAEQLQPATAQQQVVAQISPCRVGAGLMIAIQADADGATDSTTIPSQQHWSLIRRLTEDRCSPMVRQGTEPISGNYRFLLWTVPGVMQPPVYSFMAFLTMFVILVGPVAYRQTSKHGRSHLMFAIAPLLALLTTLAMLGYGIIADGFGTRVRVRQLTWVDGRSGDAGERVTATYFAGIRPGGGLRFPAQAIVMRQAESGGLSWEEQNELPAGILGKVTVDDESQIFDSSFLPSRDQRQFVVHTPRQNIGAIELVDGQSVQVNSSFAFPLRELVLRDQSGQYWHVTDLPAAASKAARQVKPEIASKRLGEMYTQYRPLAALGMTQSEESSQRQVFDPLVGITSYLELTVDHTSGIFEDWLRWRLQMTGDLPPNYFVAIGDPDPEALAVPGSELVESVRYVFGTLR